MEYDIVISPIKKNSYGNILRRGYNTDKTTNSYTYGIAIIIIPVTNGNAIRYFTEQKSKRNVQLEYNVKLLFRNSKLIITE